MKDTSGKHFGQASGIFVERDKIVTHIHAIAGAASVEGKLWNKERKYITKGVTAFNVENNLVILKVAGKGPKSLTWGKFETPQGGISISSNQGEISVKAIVELLKNSDSVEPLSQWQERAPISTIANAQITGKRAMVRLIRTDGKQQIPFGNDILLKFPEVLGSGFFVASDKIVTNIHCVGNATKIRAKLVGSETFYDIKGVTASDPKNDLVILKVAGNKTPVPLSLDNSDTFPIGGMVAAVGKENQIILGKMYNKINSNNWLRLTTQVSQGDSGSPALNGKGKVIGVFVGNSPRTGLSYAIPSNTLNALLNKLESMESLAQWKKKKTTRAYTYHFWAQELFKDRKPGDEFDKKVIELVIELLDKAIKLYPTESFYDLRGIAKRKLGQYQEAIKDYDEALELSPDFAHIYDSRGYTKYLLGKSKMERAGTELEVVEEAQNYYQSAIRDFDKAIDLIPIYVLAYNNRGNAKKALGQYEAAKVDFDKAREFERSQ